MACLETPVGAGRAAGRSRLTPALTRDAPGPYRNAYLSGYAHGYLESIDVRNDNAALSLLDGLMMGLFREEPSSADDRSDPCVLLGRRLMRESLKQMVDDAQVDYDSLIRREYIGREYVFPNRREVFPGCD